MFLDIRTHVLYNSCEMVIFDHLLSLLGLKRGSGPRYYKLDEPLQSMLETLAVQEQRPAEDIQADLIEAGLAQRQFSNEVWQHWDSLSPREKEVTVLTCMGYTNRQISTTLHISIDTVRTHMRNILFKFRLHGKTEMRQALDGWDFSEWKTLIGGK